MSLRKHFETPAAELADLATSTACVDAGAARLTLTPRTPNAAGVVLYLLNDSVGTVALDDHASVPVELSRAGFSRGWSAPGSVESRFWILMPR